MDSVRRKCTRTKTRTNSSITSQLAVFLFRCFQPRQTNREGQPNDTSALIQTSSWCLVLGAWCRARARCSLVLVLGAKCLMPGASTFHPLACNGGMDLSLPCTQPTEKAYQETIIASNPPQKPTNGKPLVFLPDRTTGSKLDQTTCLQNTSSYEGFKFCIASKRTNSLFTTQIGL